MFMYSAAFEGYGNIHDNQSLVLHNEEGKRPRIGMMQKCSIGAVLNARSQRHAALYGRLCPKPSINPQTRNKRHDRLREGKARIAGADSVLRATPYTPNGRGPNH
jgi:hypothetical protein